MGLSNLTPQTRVIAASGSWNFDFCLDDAPWVSFIAHKDGGGKLDATYQVYVCNTTTDRIPGYGASSVSGSGFMSLGTGLPPSGSAYNHYWAPASVLGDGVLFLTGTLFTGSVLSDPPASAIVDIPNTVNMNYRFIRVAVSSGWGGSMTVFPHGKTGV